MAAFANVLANPRFQVRRRVVYYGIHNTVNYCSFLNGLRLQRLGNINKKVLYIVKITVCELFDRYIKSWYTQVRYFFSAVQMFFRGKRKEVGSGLRNLDQGIEQILINIQWKKSNEKTIYDWIRSKIRGPVDNALSISPLISK